MIIEHEILEQLISEDRPLAWVISFLEDHSADAWLILLRHAEEGNIVLVENSGTVLPDWRVREVIRNRGASDQILVHCTRKGGDLVV
jgi:hypothetical protein